MENLDILHTVINLLHPSTMMRAIREKNENKALDIANEVQLARSLLYLIYATKEKVDAEREFHEVSLREIAISALGVNVIHFFDSRRSGFTKLREMTTDFKKLEEAFNFHTMESIHHSFSKEIDEEEYYLNLIDFFNSHVCSTNINMPFSNMNVDFAVKRNGTAHGLWFLIFHELIHNAMTHSPAVKHHVPFVDILQDYSVITVAAYGNKLNNGYSTKRGKPMLERCYELLGVSYEILDFEFYYMTTLNLPEID